MKEAKIAAAKRKAEMEAAIKQATLEWQWQQAELAAELGISFEKWQRIVKLLSAPSAKHVSKWLVMNSVAVGEAVVINAAVHGALTEPLRESVRHAKERSAAEPAGALEEEAGATDHPDPLWDGCDGDDAAPASRERAPAERCSSQAAAPRRGRRCEGAQRVQRSSKSLSEPAGLKGRRQAQHWGPARPNQMERRRSAKGHV